MKQQPPRAYFLGRDARENLLPRSPPGWLEMPARYWWLAGWNDADIELCAHTT